MSLNPTITPEDLLAHTAWLQRLARRLVDSSSADDLVQETWAAAVRSRPERDRPLRPWLAEVLRNLVRMRVRGENRWQARTHKLRTEAPLPTPEELFAYHEAQRVVAEAVADLGEPYRSTVLLCYAQEIQPGEIARQQGVPAGTVRWRLKRGLDQLRVTLDRRYGNDRRTWCLALTPLTGAALPVTASAPVVTGAAGAVGTAATARSIAGLGGAVLLGERTMGWKLVAALAAVVTIGAATWTLLGSRSHDPITATGSAGHAPRVTSPGAAAMAKLGAPSAVPRLAAAPSPASEPSAGSPAAPPPPEPPVAAAPSEAEVAAARKRASEPGDSPSRGPADAPVTIVMWGEFQCPFSKRAAATMRELEAAYPKDVRFFWKHLPLPFHENAALASEAALAAQEQGKFWQMHDRLFAQQEQLDPVALEQHALAVGLDLPKFKASLDSGQFRKRVDADKEIAKQARIVGTPMFFINDESLTGALPLGAFKQRIEAALAQAKGLPAPVPAPAPQRLGPQDPSRGGPRPGREGNPVWPPVAVSLPDKLLGDRVNVRFSTGDAPMRGNPKGPVEVLYFTPLGLQPARWIQEGLLSTHGEHVRLIAKLLPRQVVGARTGPVLDPEAPARADQPSLLAQAALYAHAQGKFWAFHDALGGNVFPPPDRAAIERVAQGIGLDLADLNAALEDGRFRKQIAQENELTAAAGISGFAFVVDGRKADGVAALAQLVDNAIRKAGRRPPARPKNSHAPTLNPADPGYEPRRLLDQLSPRQLFTLEPRDDSWAGAMEKSVGPLVERDLRGYEPKLAGLAFECRSTLCRIGIQAGKGNEANLLAAAHHLYGGPPVRAGAKEHFLALRPNTATPAEQSLAKLKSKRVTVIYNHRTGRARTDLGFPVDRLPKE